MKLPWTTQPKPTANEIAETELQQAERDLLAAEKDAEHYHHQVLLLKTRVARLKARAAKGNGDA